MTTTLPQPLPWHAPLADNLLAQGLPQSLMVTGRSGDGLEQLCLHLAHEKLAGADPAVRLMLANDEHPDLHILRREESTTGKLRKNIVIEQVRKLISNCNLMPMLATHRVGVICPACRLNRSSANALLKLLEEPPQATLLILGVEKPHWLPATIRSRCRLVRAPEPTTATALAWLADEDLSDAPQALALAGGAPLDAAACVALVPAHKLLLDFCLGNKQLVGQQPKLDRLEPEIWLPWTLAWAAAGTQLALELQPDDATSAKAVAQLQKQYQPTAFAWLALHEALLEMHSFATHPVVNRLLLERTVWLFDQLTQ